MAHAAYKEAHPLAQRLTHWAHLLSIAVLAFTGFYIHNPFFDGNMTWMRQLHFAFMYILLITLIARAYLAFFSRSALDKDTRDTIRDVRNFFPQKENKGQFWEMVKYYLFLRKTHPRTGKYNGLQKLTYTLIVILILLQAFTGFAMYGPYVDTFAWLSIPLGGLMVVRQIHYFIMWAFLILTAIHVYLSIAEDAHAVPLMLWGKETEAKD